MRFSAVAIEMKIDYMHGRYDTIAAVGTLCVDRRTITRVGLNRERVRVIVPAVYNIINMCTYARARRTGHGRYRYGHTTSHRDKRLDGGDHGSSTTTNARATVVHNQPPRCCRLVDSAY